MFFFLKKKELYQPLVGERIHQFYLSKQKYWINFCYLLLLDHLATITIIMTGPSIFLFWGLQFSSWFIQHGLEWIFIHFFSRIKTIGGFFNEHNFDNFAWNVKCLVWLGSSWDALQLVFWLQFNCVKRLAAISPKLCVKICILSHFEVHLRREF